MTLANILQLLREENPPPGQPRAPVPQIYDDVTGGPATTRGRHGIPGAVLYGPDGNPLPQMATEGTLTQAVDRLNAILTRLEGTLDVNVGGQIHADVDLGDVTVDIGEVQQGARGVNAEPWEVQLTGHLDSPARSSLSVLLSRNLRQAGEYRVALETQWPLGARGVAVFHRVNGVTGTFGPDEGFEVAVRWRRPGAGSVVSQGPVLQTDVSTSSVGFRTLFIYPGASKGDLTAWADRNTYVAGVPLSGDMDLVLIVTGTFSEGQGVDSEVWAQWIA